MYDFLSFCVVLSKCEEWKEEAFLWLTLGNINITAVEHALGYYLAGSKFTPNACQKRLLL